MQSRSSSPATNAFAKVGGGIGPEYLFSATSVVSYARPMHRQQ